MLDPSINDLSSAQQEWVLKLGGILDAKPEMRAELLASILHDSEDGLFRFLTQEFELLSKE